MDVDKAQVVEILRGRGDQELADRVNRELPSRFDPAREPMLAGLDLGVDIGDAARHAQSGHRESTQGLPDDGPR